MTEVTNRQRLQAIFDELARGEGGPFVDAMAEDFSWTIIGNTPWSRVYRGKETVRRDLLAPLFAQFADRYTNTAQRILVDGEYVVVQCKGKVTTRTGKRYKNTYCYVIRMADGFMKELTEQCDTALIESALARHPNMSSEEHYRIGECPPVPGGASTPSGGRGAGPASRSGARRRWPSRVPP